MKIVFLPQVLLCQVIFFSSFWAISALFSTRQTRESGSSRSHLKVYSSPVLFGLRVEEDDVKHSKGYENGVPLIIANDNVKIRLFGTGLTPKTTIKFTENAAERGVDCADFQTTEIFTVSIEDLNATKDLNASYHTGLVTVNLEGPLSDEGSLYICVRDENLENTFVHQGTANCLQVKVVHRYLIPIWIQILLIILLQSLSGLFSGLNLGLLSLDQTELAIVASVGASKEKQYAKHIIPLRKKGNFLLCSLVIGNVLVNSMLTIMLDDLTSGLYAVIFSTVGIVLFGEIVPQALCNRFGLAIGSATRYITMVVMAITCVVSYPLSRILDLLLGREIGTVYDRERLVELIRVTKDHNLLENEEMNIISGTLSLKRKRVTQIMTPLEDVFMLPYDAVLDFDTLAEITREGYTRIPVFERERGNIVSLLNIKDLALLDPDDCTAVKTLCKYYSYDLVFVFEDTMLDVLLEDFKKGRSHMAFIQRLVGDTDLDPVYETIGVVTLEDIIEEMIQAEILDESDQRPDTKMKKRDLSVFMSRPLYSSLITPQLQHASFQFLSTSIEPMRTELVSENILKRLIRHPEVARFIRFKQSEVEPQFIYQAGKAVDYFVLILEGRVEVKIGVDGLVFESGPFTYFGVRALVMSLEEMASLSKAPFPALPSPHPSQYRINLERATTTGVFIPDFTVFAVTDVLFLRIKRSHYVAALRATILERQGKAPADDTFGQEMDLCAQEDFEELGQITNLSNRVNSTLRLTNNTSLLDISATADSPIPPMPLQSSSSHSNKPEEP